MGVARTQTNRVAFCTLGCKLNFSETSTLARSLEQEGYQKVAFEEVADVYVINTVRLLIMPIKSLELLRNRPIN